MLLTRDEREVSRLRVEGMRGVLRQEKAGAEVITCPFCGDGGMDKIGFKLHLTGCSNFDATPGPFDPMAHVCGCSTPCEHYGENK